MSKTVLITGANAGIGKDVARQLALRSDVAKVYLGCRNLAKAQAAQHDLEAATGRTIFEVVPVDVSDLGSVRAAAALISEPLDALVMNAGGNGGPTPRKQTADGVTQMVASNLLGHVVLLDTLLRDDKLSEVAVYVGSEAARGVPKLRIPRPAFATSSVDELASAIDGSYFDHRTYMASLDYAQTKYLAALWMAAQARQHPMLRFITMSPGNTAGTELFNDAPAPVRLLVQRFLLPVVAPALGLAHPLQDGARRIVDAVTDPTLRSGVFYASAANALIGSVVDQAQIVPDLADPEIQDHADAALHRFTH